MNHMHEKPHHTTLSKQTDPPRLQGRWLLLARLTWVAAALLAVGVLVASLPFVYASKTEICTESFTACETQQRLTVDSAQVLQAIGLSVERYALFTIGLSVVGALIWSLVGLVIFVHRSRDPVALLAATAMITFGCGHSGAGDLLAQAVPALAFLNALLAMIAFTSLILFLYLFPNGRFVPLWAKWFALAWVIGDFFSVFKLLPDWYAPIGFVLFFVPALFSIGAQIYRYRRISNLAQQQQTKWVVFGIAAGFGSFLSLLVMLNFTWGLNDPRSSLLIEIFFPVFLLALPLSIGTAILRSRLFDIDIIIRKTLVYTLLTALLALVFFGSITLLQTVVSSITGQQSVLATVLSTLAIAALFNPLRQRIQDGIDRRFYRKKYDVQRVLAAFARTARDEVALEALGDEVLRVVEETMQPAHVGLWLRKPEKEPPNADRREKRRSAFRND